MSSEAQPSSQGHSDSALQSPESPTASLSEHSRKVLKRLEHLADCTVHTSDGSEFRLHKARLAEQSVVLGCAQLITRSEWIAR